VVIDRKETFLKSSGKIADPESQSPGVSRPELLAPGGSLEKCVVAFLYGADAVYAGTRRYTLRAQAGNLGWEELAAARHQARLWKRKLYVTVNSFARQEEIRSLPAFLEYLQEIEVDGIILSDPGVLRLAARWAPQVPIHLSTQANTTNAESVRFWADRGVKRINLARELCFEEIRDIRSWVSTELEIFVHGAMCISYSGRCLLSAALNGRSANSGTCTQPCRWSYRLVEEKRPGEYFPIWEDSGGSYIFNSRDLCLLGELGLLLPLGIDAFKVEGRMKGMLYLATVVRAYRAVMDRWARGCALGPAEAEGLEDLGRVSHRPYTRGFLFPSKGPEDAKSAPEVTYLQTHALAGIVRPSPHGYWEEPVGPGDPDSSHIIYLEVRNRLTPGTTLEFLFPDGSIRAHRLESFEDCRGARRDVAHAGTWIRFPVPFPTFPLQVVRMELNS